MIRRIFQVVLIAAAGLPACPVARAQDYSVRVVFDNNPSRNTTMGVFRRGGIVYGSITDLASIFGLGTYSNPGTEKFEIKQPPYRIKVTGGNPFIVVSDQANHQSVIQLQENVLFAANAYFVPLASFVPVFDRVFSRVAAYDAATGELRIGAAQTTPVFDITTLSLEEKTNGMLIRIPSARRLDDMESWLKSDGWLYVTLADARADVSALDAIKPVGLVSRIVAIQSPTSLQLTFKLSGPVAATELIRPPESNDVLISIRTPGNDERLLLEKRKREVQAGLEAQRKRWGLDVIVLDPGHGGKDPGTIGVTGVKEKDVTLGVALKLGKLIEKNLRGVKVVYTRRDDSFVELHRRGQIANEANGKLFISIHANSLRRKPSPYRGFEVYVLRPGRTQEAIDIAERENSVIELEEGYEDRYQKLTEENFILVTMAQSAYVKSSELFADIAQQEMEKHVGIPNHGVKQAGFLVLVGASMPNALVETAYLSNREDERYLRSSQGQQRIAEALFRSIRRYKEEYEKLLLEGADIGER